MWKKLILMFLLVGSLYALSFTTDAQVFIRIYKNGKKVGQGTIEYTLDSAIVIANKNNVQQQFFVRGISFIKTKKSTGAKAGTGLAKGMDISSRLIFAQEYYYTDDNILQGLLLGAAAGAFAGTISGVATKRKKFIINGSIEKWKPVRMQLAMMSKKNILINPRAMGYPNVF